MNAVVPAVDPIPYKPVDYKDPGEPKVKKPGRKYEDAELDLNVDSALEPSDECVRCEQLIKPQY